ncbi:MAG: hypothetical protein H6R26_1039 [Proteobacteria bacterium]|nr:hypothetical protein [Pseudomonadota bacterium]
MPGPPDNLTLYAWPAGINRPFTAGPVHASVDESFAGVADKSRRCPLGFEGRFEAHYDRLGFYLEGDYMDLDLKPKFDRISKGLKSGLGLMDYGVAYWLLGPAAAEIPAVLEQKRNANALEVYAGGRILWLENSIDLKTPFGNPLGGPRSFSSDKSFTSPVVGARFGINFTPKWFALVDGNVRGFGARDVEYTGAVTGVVDYRMSLFGFPTPLEVGCKARRYNIDNKTIKTNATLNGPLVGLTGYW